MSSTGRTAENTNTEKETDVLDAGAVKALKIPVQALIQECLSAIVITDDMGRYLEANKAACDLFGYTREQLLRMRVQDLPTPEASNTQTEFQNYKETGHAVGEFVFVKAEGETHIAAYSACRLAPGAHFSILHYVTEIRQAEQKLRETERERAYVMSGAWCLLWYADITESDHPDMLYWNSRFVDVEAAQQFLPLELRAGESYADARYHARLPEDRAACDRLGTAAIRVGRSYEQEFRCLAADGAVHWMHEDIQVTTVVEGKQWRAVGVCTDITARKMASEALRESEEKHRALFETMTQGVVYQDANGVLIDANPAAERVLGLTLEQMRGRTSRDPGWMAIYEDGSEMPGPEHPPMLALRTGEIVRDFVMGIANPTRGENRWLIVDSVPQFRPGEDRPYQVYSLFSDITEQRQHILEIETLNVRLKRSMQETHHRVKNNLQIVSALVEIQMDETDTLVPVAALVRIGQHARALAAIHDLLTQEARAGAQTDTISTQAALSKLLLLIEQTLGGRRIRYHLHDVSLHVQTVASLALLASELVSNAVKHSQGEIEVIFTANGNMARLEVHDDGPGFPVGFDWRKAANTGLNLIDTTGRYELRGAVSYENRPEGGARVIVTFPLS